MTDFHEIFSATPVMAIMRGMSPERTVALARTAWDLGIVCVEVPVQSPDTVEALRQTVAAARELKDAGKPVVVGSGTVTTLERVEQSAQAGAEFTVAPGFDAHVARASVDAGMPHLPGVATPSDIQAASAAGFTWVKAFPATVLTPAWIKAMRGPFPEVSLVCTGGIDATNARAFLDAGARGVAVGSALEDPAQLPALATLIG